MKDCRRRGVAEARVVEVEVGQFFFDVNPTPFGLLIHGAYSRSDGKENSSDSPLLSEIRLVRI
jgi:hypothetical protein